MTEKKGLVYVFPDMPDGDSKVKDTILNRETDEDLFVFNCERMMIIDLDKSVMYVADADEPKLIRLKEIEI